MDEETKENIMKKAAYLISKNGSLNIVYMRVSTKEQNELDQEDNIFDTFELNKKDCLVIRAKESAFKLKSQKFRKLNIIYEILEMYPIPRKKIYFWDLDRIYRRRTLLVDFFSFCKSHNASILSFRQKFLWEMRNLPDDLGDVISSIMVQLLGWIAEEESKKRSDRVKKTLTQNADGRFITSKNKKVHGKKLRMILSTGRKIKINDAEILRKLDDGIIRCIKKRMKYREIIRLVAKKNIRVSLGYISGLKKKRGILPEIKKEDVTNYEKMRTEQQDKRHQKYLRAKERKQLTKEAYERKQEARRLKKKQKELAKDNEGHGLLPEY